MHTQPNKLLLPLDSVQPTRFCSAEVETWGTCWIAWIPDDFLSKISLQGQFHWAMLGVCKEGIPQVSCIISWIWSWKKCHSHTECCAFGFNEKVCHALIHYNAITFSYCSNCLFVPCRFSTQSLWFMDAYEKGLTGSQAAWASWKYQGHRTLPDTILAELDNANII